MRHIRINIFAVLLTFLACGFVAHSSVFAAPVIEAQLDRERSAPINPHLFGINENLVTGDYSFDDTGFQMALDALQPGLLRYPGGTVSSYWDWENSQFVSADKVPDGEIKDQYLRFFVSLPANIFSSSNFQTLVAAPGVDKPGLDVIWVLNLLTRTSEEAEQDVIYRIPGTPKFIELGNEYNFPLFRPVLQDANAYLDKAESCIAAARNIYKYPKVEILACAPRDPFIKNSQNWQTTSPWLKGLYDRQNLFDGFVLHDYALQPSLLNSYEKESWIKVFLSYSQAALENSAAWIKQNTSNKFLAITEYNVGYQAVPDTFNSGSVEEFLFKTRRSFINGLFIADHILTAVNNHEAIKILNYHCLSQGDYMLFNRIGPNYVKYFPSAAIFAHINDIAYKSDRMIPIKITQADILKATDGSALNVLGKTDLRVINLAAFEKAGNLYVVVLKRAIDGISLRLVNEKGWSQAKRIYYFAETEDELFNSTSQLLKEEGFDYKKFPWTNSSIKVNVPAVINLDYTKDAQVWLPPGYGIVIYEFSDTISPTVSITSPTSGATVSGTVTVSANAQDNRGVESVAFILDGSTSLGEDLNSPYSVTWYTAFSSEGQHTLTAIAKDVAGNQTASAAITVTVENNKPPVLEAIGPKTIDEGKNLSFILAATDPDGNTLTYSASNLPSGANFNSSTKTFTWTPTFTQAGTYLGVRFTVTDGKLSDYEDITITVNNVPSPTAPSGLTATVDSAYQISLKWSDNSTNETGFKIERKLGATGPYAQIAAVAANITIYTNTGLAETTTYYYRVRAYNAAGNSSYSNEASATTNLAMPSNLTATALAGRQIKLTWTDRSIVNTGYEIQRKTGSSGTYSTLPISLGATATTYTNSGLTAGTTYYYRIRAYKTGGIYSSYTSAVSATAKN